MLRIGRISYANCTPIFFALNELFPAEENSYQYVGGVPSSLNSLLSAGEIDICPSSSISFTARPHDYLILPDLSISSCGPVQSVMLFSLRPVHELDGNVVLLSSESATSVNLLKILLKKYFNCSCTFQVTSETSLSCLTAKNTPAMLLIGDSALRAAQQSSGFHVYDLGEIWFQWTGLPFVFALWLTSRAALEHHGDELLRLSGQLCRAKLHSLEHLEKIAALSPEKEWLGQERLLEYWKVLSYDLSDQHLKGLNLFYRYAEEMGLIDAAPELSFLSRASVLPG